MKTPDDKKRFLEALRDNHIVLAACRKVDVSKTSYYRWRQEDPEFAKAADEAIAEGIELVNDAAESNIITAIKNKDKEASKFWLKSRHPAYAAKVRIESAQPEAPLTPEEDAKMLEGVAAWRSMQEQDDDAGDITKTNNDNYEPTPESTSGVDGNNPEQETAPGGDAA